MATLDVYPTRQSTSADLFLLPDKENSLGLPGRGLPAPGSIPTPNVCIPGKFNDILGQSAVLSIRTITSYLVDGAPRRQPCSQF